MNRFFSVAFVDVFANGFIAVVMSVMVMLVAIQSALPSDVAFAYIETSVKCRTPDCTDVSAEGPPPVFVSGVLVNRETASCQSGLTNLASISWCGWVTDQENAPMTQGERTYRYLIVFDPIRVQNLSVNVRWVRSNFSSDDEQRWTDSLIIRPMTTVTSDGSASCELEFGKERTCDVWMQ